MTGVICAKHTYELLQQYLPGIYEYLRMTVPGARSVITLIARIYRTKSATTAVGERQQPEHRVGTRVRS